jgi:hypothetical protein
MVKLGINGMKAFTFMAFSALVASLLHIVMALRLRNRVLVYMDIAIIVIIFISILIGVARCS